MTVTKEPYEFLVRWCDGVIAGSHVGFVVTVRDDKGAIVSQTALPVQPISEATDFPLEAIVKQIHVDALTQVDVLTSTNSEFKAQVESLTSQVVELEKKLNPSEQ